MVKELIKVVKILITKKINALIDQDILAKAKEIWGIVEEEFRLKEKLEEVTESKLDMFKGLLLKKFPELTEDDLYYWNKTVAGIFNKGKESKLDTESIVKENAELKVQITQLTQKLNQITIVTDTLKTNVQ